MSVWRRGRYRSEQGIIVVWMALMLLVLLGMAGFSVDLGSWYLRSSKLQRAADAAALAGVVWMPGDPSSAQAAAVAALQRNGIDVTKVAVTYPPPTASQQFRVQLTDDNVPAFFARPFLDKVTETRTATGEYVVPVPMGSPKNVLGTGDLLPSPHTENFWAAVSGWCAGREQGDLRQAGKDRTAPGGSWTCGSSLPANTDYRSTGYLYAIDFASAPGENIAIDVFDPGYDNSGQSVADGPQGVSGAAFTTTYTIYGKTPTPFDPPSVVIGTPVKYGPAGSPNPPRNTWVTVGTLNSPTAGRYFLRVQTRNNEANSYGSNGFAIRARRTLVNPTVTSTPFSVCTSIANDVGYRASCPQVHGIEDISIYASLSGATATFYLADVDPIYAGKTMQVDMFDPGEGASRMEILNPNGTAVNFDWTTPCGTVGSVTIAAPSGTTCDTATRTAGANNQAYLDVSGTGTQPYSGLRSTSKYNNRKISAFVDLPANYASAYGGKRWWKIRYTPGSAPTDRTTWAVSIVGNPLHLVQNK